MNYYNEIKQELINNEVYKRVKDYSKNKSDLRTYYNVGKLLFEAGKHYGKNIIKQYSQKLTKELKKTYTKSNLYNMLNFYHFISIIGNFQTMSGNLCWSHYVELLTIEDTSKINYYIRICEEQNLSVRELRSKIKSNEYERLDDKTKKKLIAREENKVEDFIKNPIIIKSKHRNIEVSEKVLKQLILEQVDDFLKELGSDFSYVGNEYKIKVGNRFNYIDILLYNIIYNCYVIIELKITELKKEYIGQIEIYMNYIDKNVKTISMNKTIGIIICKKDNKFVMNTAPILECLLKNIY